MFFYHVAEPNEALIVAGKKGKGPAGTDESIDFKIVTGKGVFVAPVIQKFRRLSLGQKQVDLQIDCVTTQGIPVDVRGTVLFKVGDDFKSIATAARRFLDREDDMETRTHNVFAGHLRSIVGSMKLEDMIRDRKALAEQALDASKLPMGRLGLTIDEFQIQEIDDPTGYIENLAAPHIAQVKSTARIEQAQRDQEAAQQEQQSAAQVAQAKRDSEVKQAGFAAEVQQAQAEASQEGPRAEAEAHKAVVEQQTEVAKLEAAKREQELAATIKKQAEAEAYATRQTAEAQRDAQIAQAEAEAQRTEKVGAAEGKATRAKGEAEGAALKSRAEGLRENQEAVIGQMLAERAVDIVKAASGAFDNIDNFTVLNGAEGVTEALAKIMSQGGTLMSAMRQEFTRQADSKALEPTES